MSTDSAGTGMAGTCQLESWLEGTGSLRTGVVASACTVREGLEVGGDVSLYKPSSPIAGALAIGIKWAPAHWALRAPGGTWRLAMAAGGSLQRSPGGRWIGDALDVTGIASLDLTRTVAVHLNSGVIRQHQTGDGALTWAVGTTWLAMPTLQLSAEIGGNTRRGVFGGTTTGLGARWWLQPEVLGLDFTVQREHGAGTPATWGVGLGWYGLGYRD
jgi:hypothetical protein